MRKLFFFAASLFIIMQGRAQFMVPDDKIRFSENRGFDYDPLLDAVYYNGYNNGRVVMLGNPQGNGWYLGNLGIGVTTPSNPIHVEGSLSELNILIKNTGTNGARTYLSSFAGKSSIQTDMDFTIRTNYGGWADRFYLTNIGNVGIGVSPSEKLTVNGGSVSGLFSVMYASRAADVTGIMVSNTATDGVASFILGETTNNAGTATTQSGIQRFGSAHASRANDIDIFAAGSGADIILSPANNVGIGTPNPSAKLHIANGNMILGGDPSFNPAHLNSTLAVKSKGNDASTYPFYVGKQNSGSDLFWVRGDGNSYFLGNVGIGTASPDSKLTVKGDVHTREVKVDLAGAVTPDYVFENDYVLLDLRELEVYINENKHLPEVPSASEMEQNGIKLKEMNLLLLKKVEELTLHLIQQGKRIEALEQQNAKHMHLKRRK